MGQRRSAVAVRPGRSGLSATASPAFNFTLARAAYAARAPMAASSSGTCCSGVTSSQPGSTILPAAKQLDAIHNWLAAIARRLPEHRSDRCGERAAARSAGQDAGTATTRGGGSGGYIDALGGAGVTGWDWIINGFTLARQYFPNSKLILNDYSITNDGQRDHALPADHQAAAGARAHRRASASRRMPSSTTTTTSPARQPRTPGTWRGCRQPACRSMSPSSTSMASIRCSECRTMRRSCSVTRHCSRCSGRARPSKASRMWGYVQGAHWRTNQGAWLMYTERRRASGPAMAGALRARTSPPW